MKSTLYIFGTAALLLAGPLHAQSGEELLKTKNCLGCHDMQVKKVGPAYKDVAAKYKGDKQAVATLSTKLKEGKGHPKVAASDGELKTMLGHVLATK